MAISPTEVVESAVQEDAVYCGEFAVQQRTGYNFAATIPKVAVRDQQLSADDEMEAHYDAATGAIVFIPCER